MPKDPHTSKSISKDSESLLRDLISETKGLLYQHLTRMVGNHEDTADLLQETYIRAWKNLDSFKGESKMSTWVFRIATNLALTHIEKTKRKSTISIDNQIHVRASADGPDAEDILNKVDQAMDTLPPKQKQVFIMRYYDELPYEEMSHLTSTSTGALKASYHHAVKKIEDFLTSH
ncbi:MAG: RNA polymerase sigma factor [Bacteroidetes bacterium]|nr:RNA polymerase sigma factor [Bacteroidota bacterium]MDA0974073.1 RNA polymerase sigma factor [Bacteroidota bacterium]